MIDDLAEVVRRERALLDPAVRADPGAAADLIHPDFREVGRSGRVWDRSSTLAMMAADPSVSGQADDFDPVALADGVVLLTYRTGDGPDSTRRSSIWLRGADGAWRVRFHQGTPA